MEHVQPEAGAAVTGAAGRTRLDIWRDRDPADYAAVVHAPCEGVELSFSLEIDAADATSIVRRAATSLMDVRRQSTHRTLPTRETPCGRRRCRRARSSYSSRSSARLTRDASRARPARIRHAKLSISVERGNFDRALPAAPFPCTLLARMKLLVLLNGSAGTLANSATKDEPERIRRGVSRRPGRGRSARRRGREARRRDAGRAEERLRRHHRRRRRRDAQHDRQRRRRARGKALRRAPARHAQPLRQRPRPPARARARRSPRCRAARSPTFPSPR